MSVNKQLNNHDILQHQIVTIYDQYIQKTEHMDSQPVKQSYKNVEKQQNCVSNIQKQQKQSALIREDKPQTIAQNKQQTSDYQQQNFKRICQYLASKHAQFRIIQHEATRTSQQSAIVRKTPLQWGAKTMLVGGIQSKLILLIYRANRKVSWKKIRKIPKIGKKSQMATEEQVLKLGVKPGGVPPFPHMIGLQGVLDSKFKQTQDIAFNAGHKCKSIVMKTVDFPLQNIIIDDITED